MDKDTKESMFFIYPKNTEFKKGTLVISDTIKESSYWQRDIYNMNINNKNLKNLLASFRESNIFYSSDLCGTDFKQVIDFSIKR